MLKSAVTAGKSITTIILVLGKEREKNLPLLGYIAHSKSVWVSKRLLTQI